MEADEALSRRVNPLIALGTQDLTPFSLDELGARITVLEAEIARTRLHMARASEHRASADALFSRKD